MADIETIPLLTTKFHVQSARPSNISRTHLIDRLNAGIELKLRLVSAPAGYGKSTLASEWVASLRSKGAVDGAAKPCIVWPSLDEEDDEIHRFLTYFVSAIQFVLQDSTALQGVCNATLGLLSAPLMPKPEQLLTPVLNKIAEIGCNVLFILDDLQFIEHSAMHSTIPFFIRRAPTNLHLSILTGLDPPIGLAELRAKGELPENRAADLRFSDAETMDFLSRGSDLTLSEEDIHALVRRTEGWAAGLQLSGISLRERPDASEFIQEFSGSNVYVTDYLMEEVLARQPEQVQHFLVTTSVATKLTGPLCDAITGGDDGQEIPDSLSRSNLFVIPLDYERQWYRYSRRFGAP